MESAASGKMLQPGSECHSKVELHIRCRELRKMDRFSDSDPFAVVMINGSEIGRTEVVRNNHNPEFVKSFLLDYFFEEVQKVEVRVYDEDKKGSRNLRDHDFMGMSTFLLGDIMCSAGQTITRPLSAKVTHGNNATVMSRSQSSRNLGSGFIVVHAEEVAESHDLLTLQLRGVKLRNKAGMFGTSDPFFEISRVREDGVFTPVYRSPTIMNSLNPIWPVFSIPVQALCNADYDRPLKIEIKDWVSDGKHIHMGSADTSARQLLSGTNTEIAIVSTGRGHGHRKPGGTLRIHQSQVIKRHSFLDFIRGGWEMNMVMAIDFTGSNGNPAQPGTLHYADPYGTLNQYQQTITSLSEIMVQYDNDQLFPVYGFGARGGPQGRVSHCFPLSGDGSNPYVKGVDGVMKAYRQALSEWRLSGPTLFNQVITAAAEQCRRHVQQGKMAYTLLLIVTDGVINDMQQTKDAIVAASNLPLSIIIVGVGDANFDAMEELDGDTIRVTNSQGQRASRDIVQFVNFNAFRNAAPGRLAKETLVELPDQMMAYFRSKNISPPAPTVAQREDVLPPLEAVMEGDHGGSGPPLPPAPITAVAVPLDNGTGGVLHVTAEDVQIGNIGKQMLRERL